MKKIIRILCIAIATLNANLSDAQCGAGYTQAQVNWDNLDFYYNSGGGAPYNNYVTNTMALTQKFAIGINTLTVGVGSNITINGENTSNTAEAGSYGTGADVQFTTTAAGTTITLTFAAEVQNLKFSIYDLDNNQRVNVSGVNNSSTAQSVTLSLANGTSGITFSGNPGTNPRANGIGGDYLTTDNRSAVNVDIATSVKTVTISLSNATGDFWLSDITACVLGAFPINYHQLSGTINGIAKNRPFTGPTQNQADYFLVTPDNKYVYYSDPVTGKTYDLFTDPAQPFVNSLAYDPVNHICYYVTDGSGSPSVNQALKKYDLVTGSITTVIADINTAPFNIPTFDLGVESAGAAFYNNSLYIGIEGGKYDNSNTRETIVYRIDFDLSLNPTGAAQVYALPAYSGSTSLNDWGDFIIKDGVLYNFNTARSGGSCGGYNWTNSSVIHYDMTMDNVTVVWPHTGASSATFGGQVGMNWAGDIYSFWYNCNPTPDIGGIQKYNLNGTFAANTNISVQSGPAWPGGAGDASDPFRPKCDFGDAPTTYDPNPVSPAVHERTDNIRLGNTWDNEWIKRGTASTNDVDDGLAYVPVLNPTAANYLTQVYVYNNSGANATVCAWLDYNGNGVFDASEGITATVSSSASTQLIWLYWPSAPTSLPMGSTTYLRVRVTSASAGMTTSMPTGFFFNGEVEDYAVTVNSYPLAVQNSDFNAQLTKEKNTSLTWTSADESDINYYNIEKSNNNNDWNTVEMVYPKAKSGLTNYEVTDGNVSAGITYYRLKTVEKDGRITISSIKQVDNKVNKLSISVTPNPATSKATVHINAPFAEKGTLEIVNSLGVIVYKENVRINAGTNAVALPVLNLINGSYIVKLTTDTKSLHQSLIVKK